MTSRSDLSHETNLISSLVVPAAGLGTRMFPATLSVPKGLLPLGHHTVLDEILNEACSAGLTSCVIVVGFGEELYRDYLSKRSALAKAKETSTSGQNSTDLSWVGRIDLKFVRQPEPLGMGDAILRGAQALKEEPFALIIPDTVVIGSNVLCDAVELANRVQSNVLSVAEVDESEIGKYGAVELGEHVNGGFYVKSFEEKPKQRVATLNRYFNGRAVLTPEFVRALESLQESSDAESQFSDACKRMVDLRRMVAVETKGITFDCGCLYGWHAANCHSFGKSSP